MIAVASTQSPPMISTTLAHTFVLVTTWIVPVIPDLVKLGANVDFKILLNQYNSNRIAIEQMFQVSADAGVRMLYFRPAIINGQAHPWGPAEWDMIRQLGEKYQVTVKLLMV